MFRILTCALALTAVSQPAFADDHADYGINLGFSPFGGSVGLIYNPSASTSVNVAFGGSPAVDAPFKLDIDGTEYTQNGGSSWMGFFLNHRPFEDSQWFRINTGIGIGGIQGTLTNDAGDEYKVEYNENPVGYIGVGFGSGTAEGFTFGFDIGGLYGSGPEIESVKGSDSDLEAIQDNAFFGNVLPNLQLSVGYNF